MSATNFFNTEQKAFDLRLKTVTSSATVTTYTARVGGVANNFQVDRVINVVTVASCNITITVPNGQYEGQKILINFLTEGSAETVTITCTTGTDYTMATAGMYVSLEWTNATTGWVALASSTTT